MYRYIFTESNPEGIDFVIEVCHEEAMSYDEFQTYCEKAIIACLDNEVKETGTAFKGNLDNEFIYNELMKMGFKPKVGRVMARFDYEPFSSFNELGKELKNKIIEIEKQRNKYDN